MMAEIQVSNEGTGSGCGVAKPVGRQYSIRIWKAPQPSASESDAHPDLRLWDAQSSGPAWRRGSTGPTTVARGLIAHWIWRLRPGRHLAPVRRRRARSSLDRCWEGFTTSMSGWRRRARKRMEFWHPAGPSPRFTHLQFPAPFAEFGPRPRPWVGLALPPAE